MATPAKPQALGGDGADLFEGYAPPQDRPPLGSYAVLCAAFAAGCVAFIAASRRGKVKLPEEIGLKDLLIVGVGTHKLSRLIAKDKVTSFLRAPFRRYEDDAGPAELSEETRGEGMRAAVGELIGCPYCLGLWFASGMTAGLTVAPRETRLAASTLTAVTIADFMQIAYALGQDKL
jgi:hypothetical protein